MIAIDQLVAALPQATRHNWRPLEIHAIASDSRQVAPGDLFVAVPGVAVDGHRFVGAALAAGAAACVVEHMLPELEGVPTAVVPNAREALGWLYAAWYGHPSRQLRVIGITAPMARPPPPAW
jgi:UDP-N-acetylmuramoyl-L-alanyl-D-glutamate--2,6-diaminopimelate ligase